MSRFDSVRDSLDCMALTDSATRAAIARGEQAAMKRDQLEGHRRAAAIHRHRIAAAKAMGWADDVTRDVIAGRLHVGMTADMVRLAWGPPRHINRTLTAAHVSEQWVYASDYVYLEDGVVTSIQESR